MEPSRTLLPLPASCLSHVDAQVLLLICAVATIRPSLSQWLLYTALPPAVGDEETDNEKPRGSGVGGQPQLSPDPRTVSH